MGGGGTSTNTVMQNPEPYTGAKEYINKGLEEAFSTYRSAPAAYHPQYVAMTPAQRSAMQDIESLNGVGWSRLESANSALGKSGELLQDLSGMTRNPYETNFRNMADTAQSMQYGNMAGLADQGRALSDTYAGKYLTPDSNPYLRQYYQQAADEIGGAYRNQTVPTLMSTFGSPNSSMYALYQGEANRGFSDSLQKAATNIFGNAYEQERQRQMAAAGQLAGIYQGAEQMYADTQARKAGLYGQAAGLYQQGYQNRSNLAQQQMGLSQLYRDQANAELARRAMSIDIGNQFRQDEAQRLMQESPDYGNQIDYANRVAALNNLANITSKAGWGSAGSSNQTTSGGGNAMAPLYGVGSLAALSAPYWGPALYSAIAGGTAATAAASQSAAAGATAIAGAALL